MSRYLDIGRVLSFDQLVTLRDHGDFVGVVPYLDPFNAKGATAFYLEDIYRAGMKIPGFFYQTTGGAGQGDAYFTRHQGQLDATWANELLANFLDLVPAKVIVWYAVDMNIEPSLIDDYATGIEDMAGGSELQTPGLYGYQRLMAHAQHAYPNMGKHLAQTYGVEVLGLDLWQHEQITINGITVDVDEVYVDGWSPKEGNVDTPERVGQGPDLQLHLGEVGLLQAQYHYATGQTRDLVRKVWSHKPGRYIYTIRPPVDPDSDETEHIDAEPSIFVVDVEP